VKLELALKVVGHELVTSKAKQLGQILAYDMGHVKLRGVGEDKTRCMLVVDPERLADFPLGEVAIITAEIRQQKLALK
jgi:hypothetical protein